MKNPRVTIRKVYSKQSHTQKPEHHYAPVYSIGSHRKNSFDVVVHMTPELRNRPAVRKAFLRHETREAKLLAEGKSVHQAHMRVRRQDPKYLKKSSSVKRLGPKWKNFELPKS
jgi:hypothetical protein